VKSSIARAIVPLAIGQIAVGAAAIFARYALTGAGPLAVSSLRLAIAAMVICALALAFGRYRTFAAASERRLALAGLVLALHFAAWITSLRFASVTISTLLVCSAPIWTEAYAVLRARKARPDVIVSILTALIGVGIVVGLPTGENTPLGLGLAIAGAWAWAAYLIVVRGVDRRYDTLAIVGRTYPIAALLLAGAAAFAGQAPPPLANTVSWGGIIAMALISQLFGHTALNIAVRTLSPTFVATTTLLEPLIAALLAAILFQERLAPSALAGAVVILGAIALAIRAEDHPAESAEGPT
jgi:drug/metabolite transporter (DMT)-like permease